MSEPGLTPERAGRVYDRIGRLQDWQRFYEGPAVEDLEAHADFEHVTSVFELGCGTGAMAAHLLDERLPPSSTYTGVDVSAKMVALTAGRLERFGDRASVQQVPGDVPLPGTSGAFDRFLALYVLELLPDSLARALVQEAERLLAPDGRLCIVSLTHGTTGPSRALCSAWNGIWRLSPAVVGGCHPIDVVDLLPGWRIEHVRTVVAWAVPSQIVVAARPAS